MKYTRGSERLPRAETQQSAKLLEREQRLREGLGAKLQWGREVLSPRQVVLLRAPGLWTGWRAGKRGGWAGRGRSSPRGRWRGVCVSLAKPAAYS